VSLVHDLTQRSHKIQRCPGSAAGEAPLAGAEAHVRGLPRRIGPGGRGEADRAANELEKTHPGAAASLREGLQETLTVLRLGVPTHP
jgi:hypothetical protein